MAQPTSNPVSPAAWDNMRWLEESRFTSKTGKQELLDVVTSKTEKIPEGAPWTVSTIIREDRQTFSATSVPFFLNGPTGGHICSEAAAVGTARANPAAIKLRYVAIATVTHDQKDAAPCERCVAALNELSPGMVAFRIDAQTQQVFSTRFLS